MDHFSYAAVLQVVVQLLSNYSILCGIATFLATVLFLRKCLGISCCNKSQLRIGKRENFLNLSTKIRLLGDKSVVRAEIFNDCASLILDKNIFQKFVARGVLKLKASKYQVFSKCTDSRSLFEPGEKFITMYKSVAPKYAYSDMNYEDSEVDYVIGNLKTVHTLIHVICSTVAIRGTDDLEEQLEFVAIDMVMFRLIGAHVLSSACFDKAQNQTPIFVSLAKVLDKKILNSGVKGYFEFSFLKVNERYAIQCWKNIFAKLVQVRRLKLRNGEESDFTPGICLSYINLVLQQEVNSACHFSDDEIVEDLMSMQLEQFHFVATTLKVIVFLLGKYPAVQTKLRGYVDKSFEKLQESRYNAAKLSRSEIKSLMNMPYMDAIVFECMRFLPPRPFIGRQFSKDVILDGQNVTAGSNAWFSVLRELQMRDVFSNADIFDPERFMNNEAAGEKLIALQSLCCEPEVSEFIRNVLEEIKLIVGSLIHELSVKTMGKLEDLQVNAMRGILFPNGLKVQCKIRNCC